MCNTRSSSVADKGIVKILDDILIFRIFFLNGEEITMLFKLIIIIARLLSFKSRVKMDMKLRHVRPKKQMTTVVKEILFKLRVVVKRMC